VRGPTASYRSNKRRGRRAAAVKPHATMPRWLILIRLNFSDYQGLTRMRAGFFLSVPARTYAVQAAHPCAARTKTSWLFFEWPSRFRLLLHICYVVGARRSRNSRAPTQPPVPGGRE
jgi:hypothetical protein